MLAPTPIVHDPTSLLADVRLAVSLRPFLVDYPERLAALLKADECAVQAALGALEIEGEVLA